MGAMVKVAMPTSDDQIEVIWVEPFKGLGGDKFVGLLANAPNDLPGREQGSEVQFTRDQVQDWSFWGDDQRMYGNFTTRVMLPHLDADQAAQLRAILSHSPLPNGW